MACHNIAEQRSFADDLDTIRNERTIEQPSIFMTATFRMKWGNHGIGKETTRKHTQRNELRDITQKTTNIARILPKKILRMK